MTWPNLNFRGQSQLCGVRGNPSIHLINSQKPETIHNILISGNYVLWFFIASCQFTNCSKRILTLGLGVIDAHLIYFIFSIVPKKFKSLYTIFSELLHPAPRSTHPVGGSGARGYGSNFLYLIAEVVLHKINSGEKSYR